MNARYHDMKEREYKVWVVGQKEFSTLEAARKYKKRKNEPYDYVRYTITERVEKVLTFVKMREVR